MTPTTPSKDAAETEKKSHATVVKATVDRTLLETNTVPNQIVYLDSKLMESLGLDPGAFVEIVSPLGRRTLARLGSPLDEDSNSGVVRLGRLIRKSLKAKLNDTVEIRGEHLEPARRVLLEAPIDVARAHGLVDHIRNLLATSQTPCSRGSYIYSTFHNSNSGGVFEVIEADDEPCYFDDSTILELQSPDVANSEDSVDIGFEDVGGLGVQITQVRELIQLPLQMPFIYRQLGITSPRGIIFYGPPGVGKTYLAKAIANDIHAKFFFINGPSVVGTMQGETESNLRRIFSEAAHHAPSIIFIDEVDAIASRRGESGSLSDVRAVTTLLSCMDGLDAVDGVVVIGTTNRMNAIDVAMRRPGRFDREIFIGPPDENGRFEILEIHTREMPLSQQAQNYLQRVAAMTHGFVGADLMELAREAGLAALRRQSGSLLDHRDAFRFDESINLTIEPEDFDAALSKIRPSGLREAFVSVPSVSWNDIGGLETVKRQLQNLVLKPLENSSAYRKMGLPPTNGILLHGPAGTGKTMLVHALAKSAKINFLSIDGPEIFSKWLGESEEAIRHIFQIARQVSPTIIFLDQIDAIAPRRGSDDGSRTTERVVNQLLGELDSVRDISEIIVIGATNRIDLIDPAIMRPGRLGKRIEVGLPGKATREAIAELHLANAPLEATFTLKDASKLVAELTDGLSGADVAGLMIEVKTNALAQSDFTKPIPINRNHIIGTIQGLS